MFRRDKFSKSSKSNNGKSFNNLDGKLNEEIVYVFVNPSSGGQEGKKILTMEDFATSIKGTIDFSILD